MSIPILEQLLGLPHLTITGHELPNATTVILDITPTLKVALCPDCGHPSVDMHDYDDPRLIRDLSLWGRHCFLRLRGRRFECETCGHPFTERLEWVDFGSSHTRRYESDVFELCRKNTPQYVSQLEDLGYDAVEGIFLRLGKKTVDQRKHRCVRVISLDEIALKKGHDDFVLVIGAPEESYVIDLLSDRKKETLEAWLDQLAPDQRSAIQVVCIDMWEAYCSAVQAKLPGVEIVVDRFHVMKNLNHALTTARREIQRQAAPEVKEQLKGSRWVLVRNQSDLNPEQREKLDTIYAVSPELKLGHQLKEQFRAIFELTDRDDAARQLDDWIHQVETSGLKAFQGFVTTLRNWHDYILNYFHERWSNGFAEGMNNKIKLLKRRGFGYTNFDHFRLRVLVECGP